MKWITTLLIACIMLGGCAQSYIDPAVVKRADASGWRVDCTTDRTLDVRRCYASKMEEGRLKENSLEVYYLNNWGPFIRAGYHTDPVERAVVRVGDSEPIILTNINEYAIESTSAAHIADARRVVSGLRRGGKARVRFSAFADLSKTMMVDVSGFDAAYRRLTKRLGDRK